MIVLLQMQIVSEQTLYCVQMEEKTGFHIYLTFASSTLFSDLPAVGAGLSLVLLRQQLPW